MAEMPAVENPYLGPEAAVLRAAFENGQVSDFENRVNLPRFSALLPTSPKIRRILDVGCGPAFPQYLRNIYPDAEIVGVDVSPTMLPDPRPDDPKARFATWQGPGLSHDEAKTFLEAQGGRFDLVVVKMVMHYLEPAGRALLSRDIETFLAHGGCVALSMPHPDDSARFASADRLNTPHAYTRAIGQTGIQAQMHHPTSEAWWWNWQSLAIYLPDSYRILIDEPTNDDGARKRLNMLLRPATRTEKIGDALWALIGKRQRHLHRVDLGANA